MRKNRLNFIIDVIMLLVMVVILSIGLLVKYMLPTGQEKWELYGENREFLFMNLDRHQWGEIHYLLGIVLIALLILHILLHWKQIVCIYTQWIKAKVLRILLAWAFLVIMVLIVLIPFIVKPQIGEDESHYRNKNNDLLIQEKKTGSLDEEHTYSAIDINGQMSLDQISKEYKIPCNELKKKLGIPVNISNDERIGRLRKQYNFSMQQIKDIINEHQKLQNHE